MSVTWRKALRDLAHNKLRTLLAALSTAVGVFALGLVFGMFGVMQQRMTEDYKATNPAHINLWRGPFDQKIVEAVLQEPGVDKVELMIWAIPFRWKLEGETEWRDGDLYAREDYDNLRMDMIDLLDGQWPAKRTLAVERQSSNYFGVPLGTTITVEFGQYERTIDIEGLVRVSSIQPPSFGGDPTFYATAETITWLTGHEGFDDLYITLKSFTQEGAEETAERIKDRLERMGLPIGGPWIRDPEVHWIQEQVDAMFLILGVLGTLSLGLSAFLIINTMNAIIAQQVWQIGVMKAVGATVGSVIRIYLTTTLIYGTLASLIAVPLGALGAYWMAEWMLDLLNIEVGSFQITPTVALVQIAVGLSVPVLAALMPVISGARISAHQAISNYGLGAGFGHSWLDRLIGRIRRLPRPMTLSLRNTFRRKARVALTLTTLILGGVIFIMVMSVGESLNNTIDVLIRDFGDDVTVIFERPYHVDRLIKVTESVPGVTAAEVWARTGATFLQENGEERRVSLWGAPPDSVVFNPRIVNGRGLLPADGRAILLNNKIAVDEGIQVGDEIELTIGDQEITWTVIGLVLNIGGNQTSSFVPFNALAQEIGNVNRGTRVVILAEQHDTASQQALIDDLKETYNTHRIEATYFWSAGEMREQNKAQFDLITNLMLTMAILAAVVGSLGLMGTMSINVIERGREIGVMRSTGATSLAIARIVIFEGVLLGVLSWLFAAPLSYPSAQVFSQVIGTTLMELPLDFSYSASGMLLWLAIVVVMSTLASLWPALRATRVSVRESLAYE